MKYRDLLLGNGLTIGREVGPILLLPFFSFVLSDLNHHIFPITTKRNKMKRAILKMHHKTAVVVIALFRACIK
ncbi:MAG: hypothetical protein IPP77_09695 [Bacteroidetes bacterium]|nr:hypothetical protein [Bacteroidota bacterium]